MKLGDDIIESLREIGRMQLDLALSEAAVSGGHPTVKAVRKCYAMAEEISEKYGQLTDEEAHAIGLLSQAMKQFSLEGVFSEFDHIRTSDRWQEVMIPLDRWSHEVERIAAAAGETATLELATNHSAKRERQIKKKISLLIQRESAGMLSGYPLPRVARLVIVNYLLDVARKAFEKRLQQAWQFKRSDMSESRH
ncbi:hypothetical protein [Methylocystis echinoides]|uniref:Uncharacterized protein n=1 Tax=Methylocystis echinoides TaxID=29468 RepID=A0A9W6GVB4_9HYPH|nr:hypothetical protein [Methylocystis echinoides]GLI93603.1 hypothetical protein LMG27198_25950 [Methylocystis echinoides]